MPGSLTTRLASQMAKQARLLRHGASWCRWRTLLEEELLPGAVVLPMATTWQRRHCMRASKPFAMLCPGRFVSRTKTRQRLLFCGRGVATAGAARPAEERP
eukprot:s7585_g5.t1